MPFCFPEVLFFFQKCPIIFQNSPSNFSLHNRLENAVFEPLENFSEGSALSTLQGGLQIGWELDSQCGEIWLGRLIGR